MPAVQHLHSTYSQPLGKFQQRAAFSFCSAVVLCSCGTVQGSLVVRSMLSVACSLTQVCVAGINRRCKNRVMPMQPESYDSRGVVEGSSLGSSPKMISESFEPIPMSC